MFLPIRPARNQPDFWPMIEAGQNGPKIGENLYGKCCRIGTMHENGFFFIFLQNQISLMRIFWAFHYLRLIQGGGARRAGAGFAVRS
jgi:hypothetical protein